jgi:LPXTG-motif cell wall-anchored protein
MLEETTVPYGFNKMDPITFTIIATHTVNGVDPELEGFRTIAMGEGSLENGMLVNDVVNYTGTVLPETGAAGTMWIIFGSTTLVILAAVFMITRKKMSVYED